MNIEIESRGYFKRIAQFKMLKDIGVGSFGKVKLAEHLATRKNYAIKIIDLAGHITQNEISLLNRQIKVHSKLDHPHIIKLWDTIQEGSKIFMVMEYAKNGSVFKHHSRMIEQGSQPSNNQIYQYFYQTLQAIKYMHRNDIMHRDIKPQNLLLDEDFNIKLCDFGWATSQIEVSRTTFCGTYQYMAPEMALEKNYDYRIDIWALGVLLYQLVHGKAPFQAENLKIMKQKINKGSYQIDSNCSSKLKNLIIDILQFSPQKRLSINQIENHAWVLSFQNSSNKQQKSIEKQKQKNEQEATVKNIKLIQSMANKLKKHQHQKSMGSLVQYYKNNYGNIKGAQQVNQATNKQNISHLDNMHEATTHENIPQVKKHRRNITQPNTDYGDKITQSTQNKLTLLYHYNNKKTESGEQFHKAKKNQIILNQKVSLLTTPSSFNRSKVKCKTQAEEDFYDLEKNQTPDFQKSIFDLHEQHPNLKSKQNSGLEKALTHHKVVTGHMRNFSGECKQNEGFSNQNRLKMKKKPRMQQKQKMNPKVKLIQQKLNEISNKLGYQKMRQADRTYFS